jgi:adenine specific DNA methylase Mod
MTPDNALYYGDNLDILRQHIADESVDLIYLDPPFNSARSYNLLFKDESGHHADAQITAFEDTWHWGRAAEETYADLVANAPERVGRAIAALRDLIGTNEMMAYLTMMTARLVELHRVLKPTGSLYLHCDPTASHYLKVILDTIFGGGLLGLTSVAKLFGSDHLLTMMAVKVRSNRGASMMSFSFILRTTVCGHGIQFLLLTMRNMLKSSIA